MADLPSPPLVVLPGLLAGGWRGLAFGPFRPGMEIHRLYGGDGDGPSAALLRYAPGGSVPLHEHTGFEHVLVLDGSQEDGPRRSPLPPTPGRARRTRPARGTACGARKGAWRCWCGSGR